MYSRGHENGSDRLPAAGVLTQGDLELLLVDQPALDEHLAERAPWVLAVLHAVFIGENTKKVEKAAPSADRETGSVGMRQAPCVTDCG